MQKWLAGLALWLGGTVAALAQGTPMTKSQLYTLSNTTYCSTPGCITPTTMKTLTNDIIASYYDAGTLAVGFDSVFCSTQGSVLYRSGSAWSCLAPGSAGQFLQTGGSSANPAWASGTSSPVIRSADPNANDDSGDGYAVGTQWLNNTQNVSPGTGRFWQAFTVGVGTAQWYSYVLFDTANNVFGGRGAGGSLAGGDNNVFLGTLAGRLATTGGNNIAIGSNTLQQCTTCALNVGIGQSALNLIVDDVGHTAVGWGSLANMSGTPVAGFGPWNSAFGHASMFNMTTGGSNVCAGRACMYSETTGIFNTALGHAALYTGVNNTSVVGLGDLAGGAVVACVSGGGSRTVIPVGLPNAGAVMCPFTGETESIAIGTYAGGGPGVNDGASVGLQNRVVIGSYARVGNMDNTMALGNGMTDVVTAGRLWDGTTISTVSNAAGVTLSAANLISGVYYRVGAAAAFTDTTPTAANVLAGAMGNGVEPNLARVITVINGTTHTMSLALGAGITTGGAAPFTILGGTNMQFVLRVTNAGSGAAALTMDRITSDVAKPADVQVFSTPGVTSWTKPSGAKTVKVILRGSGGGGGSGPQRASGSASSGGAGGGGGGCSWADYQASDLGTSEIVSVGAKGTGGPAIAAINTNGTAGTNGNVSTFGSGTTILRANGGLAGGAGVIGGGSTAGTGGTGREAGGLGGAGVSGAAGGNAAAQTAACTTGGGAGAGENAPTTADGGAGGVMTVFSATGAAGGIGAAKTAAVAGTSFGAMVGTGGGGGGGWANADGTAGNGAIGGNYGGGGGGGGASVNGSNSGAGGNGADGIVVVITSF